MSRQPTRQSVEGRAYLDLQNLARRAGRPTDEFHQLYALEGFIDRLVRSPHADRFVLKGALLLAAFEARRPTRDVDLAARGLHNDIETVRQVVVEVLAVDVVDGLAFDATATRAEAIRDESEYGGVRVTVFGSLAAARLQFHVDVNVGDPITPRPTRQVLPRLLGGELRPVGYPLEMVLAEKIVTAVQRGTANTRWRDFVDVARLGTAHPVDGDRLTTSVRRVADHREVMLEPLAVVLQGFGVHAQDRWARWRHRFLLADVTPESFEDLLDQVIRFADPVLTADATGHSWEPMSGLWT